ncbi:hypothetical protein AJ80_06642 [Polytolypa hystricis UAMH7299]|uniref:RlpA-like protein double-psi beta-barrel domain-containing protein n=1 Tax=Polytolypa hystricis (strain UAMH7299) TaxID=1447883 RepID=A0A2B7XU14_POLH7|nr:hypothetical protein AJ80_06642 [Polytolypa hystricis UAMH7299]
MARPNRPVSILSVESTISVTTKTFEHDGMVTIQSQKTATMKDIGVQVSMSEVPKRKPVPASVAVLDDSSVEEAYSRPLGRKWGGGIGSLFSCARFDGDRRRKKRILIIAGVVGLVLLALIIGLAVGLTMRNNAKNLPLPTDNGGPYTGDLTYYDPGLGACGIISSGSEPICAVSRLLYDAASTSSDPNQNPLCGKMIRLKRGDRSVDVKVVDRCEECKATDIDVSMSVFEELAEIDLGRVDVQWAWLEKAPVNVPAV